MTNGYNEASRIREEGTQESEKCAALLQELKKENVSLRHELKKLEEEVTYLKLKSALNENVRNNCNDETRLGESDSLTESSSIWRLPLVLRFFWSRAPDAKDSTEEVDRFITGNDDQGDKGETTKSAMASESSEFVIRKHHRQGESLLEEEEVDRFSTKIIKSCAKENGFEAFEIENDNENENGYEIDDNSAAEIISFLDRSFCGQLRDRAQWLVGLLILQSCSSFILKKNEDLLQSHTEIVHFLTMLVGAGGNAGNQACVRVIRELALGTLTRKTTKLFLYIELKMAFCISGILAVSGLIRAAIFFVPAPETVAITASLWMIVIVSIGIGALLPLGMKYVGIDPAHSSTTIQVLMDILGVTITVLVSSAILTAPKVEDT